MFGYVAVVDRRFVLAQIQRVAMATALFGYSLSGTPEQPLRLFNACCFADSRRYRRIRTPHSLLPSPTAPTASELTHKSARFFAENFAVQAGGLERTVVEGAPGLLGADAALA